MNVRRQLSRQWVPIVGGSCDVRMGEDAIMSASKVFVDSVSRPGTCLIVARGGEDAELLDELCRQATDAGFSCDVCELEPPLRTFDAAARLAHALREIGATADDLCVAVGDADLISVASYVCGAWCQGMSVVAVPLDELGLLEGALVPRALDVDGAQGMLFVRPCVKHVVIDYGRVLGGLDDESSRRARVLMAGTSLASSEKEFSTLWDRAEQIMADDGATLCAQLMDTAKARGKLAASSAAAVRASLGYGRSFANACQVLMPNAPYSGLLAEGMRFCARISVAQGKLPLDDMLAIDELLDALGITPIECDVNQEELVEAFRRERLLRSRRLMLEIPLAIGRIRLSTVEDGMLREHLGAWCVVHRRQGV